MLYQCAFLRTSFSVFRPLICATCQCIYALCVQMIFLVDRIKLIVHECTHLKSFFQFFQTPLHRTQLCIQSPPVCLDNIFSYVHYMHVYVHVHSKCTDLGQYLVYICTCRTTFVGHRLATKVFISKLLATRGVWVIIRRLSQ